MTIDVATDDEGAEVNRLMRGQKSGLVTGLLLLLLLLLVGRKCRQCSHHGGNRGEGRANDRGNSGYVTVAATLLGGSSVGVSLGLGEGLIVEVVLCLDDILIGYKDGQIEVCSRCQG